MVNSIKINRRLTGGRLSNYKVTLFTIPVPNHPVFPLDNKDIQNTSYQLRIHAYRESLYQTKFRLQDFMPTHLMAIIHICVGASYQKRPHFSTSCHIFRDIQLEKRIEGSMTTAKHDKKDQSNSLHFSIYQVGS